MYKEGFPFKLYLVISESACKVHFLDVIKQAILGGVDIVQLREKHLSEKAYLSRAISVKALTDRYNVPLIINDNLEVARKAGAFGIHVGNSDIAPTLIRSEWQGCQSIGYSIEYLHQLQNEETAAADYLGISPVFTTPTKSDTVTSWGLEGIKAIRQLTAKPLIAIGGIHLGNIGAILSAGANCIAVVSAICGAADPGAAAFNLKNEIIRSI